MLAKAALMKSRLLLLFMVLLFTSCAPQVAATPVQPSAPASASVPPITTEAPVPTPMPSPTEAATVAPEALNLVAIGDSIGFNSEEDCPGCTGFVDRYAEAISIAAGRPVEFQNLTKHTGLQIDRLLELLEKNVGLRNALANADIIIVNIAHNDIAWGRDDDPCDGPTGENPDWSKFDATCAAEAAEIFRPKFENLYTQIVDMRAGKPTIFLTINRYNDWIGDGVPPAAIQATYEVVDAWSAMICQAATSNGFLCADIYHAFNGADGLQGASDLLAADFTHPSEKGNEVIAQVLSNAGYAPLVP